MKYILLITVFYLFYRIYKIGMLNGAKNVSEIPKNNHAKSSDTKASQREYTDYEEIK